MAAATQVNALLQECDDVVLAGLPLALLLPGHARHRNGILSGVMPPMLSRAEVRPGVLRHFCGDLPAQVMYKRLIELSRMSAFAATVVSTKGTDGARRHCADCLSAEQPHCQACILNAQDGTGNAEFASRRGRLVQHRHARRLYAGPHVCGLGGGGQVCNTPRTLPGLRAFTLGSRYAPAILMYQ